MATLQVRSRPLVCTYMLLGAVHKRGPIRLPYLVILEVLEALEGLVNQDNLGTQETLL